MIEATHLTKQAAGPAHRARREREQRGRWVLTVRGASVVFAYQAGLVRPGDSGRPGPV
jgi:hypothetical protein